jgi:hypothetical protein
MEKRYRFNVIYQGKLLASVYASTKWEAIERVYSQYHDVDRTKLFSRKCF